MWVGCPQVQRGTSLIPHHTPSTVKRAMLDAQIDAAVKSGRKKVKRRKKDDGEVSARVCAGAVPPPI